MLEEDLPLNRRQTIRVVAVRGLANRTMVKPADPEVSHAQPPKKEAAECVQKRSEKSSEASVPWHRVAKPDTPFLARVDYRLHGENTAMRKSTDNSHRSVGPCLFENWPLSCH
jgi:hypothetical protein